MKIFTWVLVAVLLSGCITTKVNKIKTFDYITTKEDVITELGKPTWSQDYQMGDKKVGYLYYAFEPNFFTRDVDPAQYYHIYLINNIFYYATSDPYQNLDVQLKLGLVDERTYEVQLENIRRKEDEVSQMKAQLLNYRLQRSLSERNNRKSYQIYDYYGRPVGTMREQ